MSNANLIALKFKLQRLQNDLRRRLAEAERRRHLAKLKLQQLESELRRLR